MEVLRKPIAVVLAVIGIAVTVRHVLGTYYIDALRDLDLQTVLDPFMAVAVALALIVQFVGKRNLDAKITGDTITRRTWKRIWSSTRPYCWRSRSSGPGSATV